MNKQGKTVVKIIKKKIFNLHVGRCNSTSDQFRAAHANFTLF